MNVSNTAPPPDLLGMIAGNRNLPLLMAREARQAGVKRLVAVAFEGETDPALTELVDEIEWIEAPIILDSGSLDQPGGRLDPVHYGSTTRSMT